jgi:multidrug efflux pump subunit AcrA (membrane-fusion protein)
MIFPTTNGLLAELDVQRGQKVAPQQKLFTLDLTDLKAQRDGAEASLKLAQANLKDLLKGGSFNDIWPQVWPLLIMMLAITFVAMNRYRRTLD